jgi:hypothetical protein
MQRSLKPALIMAPILVLLASCSNGRAEMLAALADVCSWQGVEGAAAYEGADPHPVVLVASDGMNHAWSDQLPDAWEPESLADVELVACVHPEREVAIEVCQYNGPDITRYRNEVEIRLMAARTGAQVAATVVRGTDPRECQQMEDYDLVRLEGSHVSYDDVEAWLRLHAEGAAAAPVSGQPAQWDTLAPRPDWPGQDVWVYCGQAGLSPITINGDEPVILSWNWIAGSWDNVRDYVDAASFDLRMDGENVDLTDAVLSGEECEWGACVTWQLPPLDLPEGKHTTVMTVTLSREVSTGLDFDQDGVPETDPAGEWVSAPCEIVVE